MDKKRLISIVGILIIIMVSAAGSFYFGYNQGEKNPQTIIVEGVENITAGEKDSVDFTLFWEAWNSLKERHVDADNLTSQNMLYSAIQGITQATKDPYTNFFPPAEAQQFTEDISGEFGGIGIEIGKRDGELTVIAPLKNTPAEKTGLKTNDKILSIDGKSAIGISVDEAVKTIRGKKGTKVLLKIYRNEWPEPKDIEIIRDTIQIPTLDWKMLDFDGNEVKKEGILYIQLYNFYEKAPLRIYQMAIQAAFQNPRGIIIDLRNNPGGYLEAAINISGWFLENGSVVVKEKFRSEEEKIFTSAGTELFKDLPVVVLINQGSASASEILAGALQDNRGVKLVGEKSFGKGSVQEVINLRDGSLLKITFSYWLTPSGRIIEKEGLIPDVEIKLTEEDFEEGRDPQLEKAMEILKQETGN